MNLTGTQHTNAGSYTDTWTFTDPTGDYASESGTITDIIAQAPFTVTANPASGTYGSPVVLNGVTYSGFANGETAVNLTQQAGVQTNATSSSPVGLYGITVTAAIDQNYTFTYVSSSYTINPAALTITANNASGSYGITPALNGVTYNGFVGTDTSSSLSTAPTVTTTAKSSSSVGAYPITGSGAVDPNYTITYPPGTYTVTTATPTMIVVDNGGTYNGRAFTATATVNGLSSLEGVTPTLDYQQYINGAWTDLGAKHR